MTLAVGVDDGDDEGAGGTPLVAGGALGDEVKERDLGRLLVAVPGVAGAAEICGEPGDGVLASLAGGLDTGVLPVDDWRKLVPRTRHGSDSSVGRPVADVVVVHVLVDMRRIRFGGRLLRSFCCNTYSCSYDIS